MERYEIDGYVIEVRPEMWADAVRKMDFFWTQMDGVSEKAATWGAHRYGIMQRVVSISGEGMAAGATREAIEQFLSRELALFSRLTDAMSEREAAVSGNSPISSAGNGDEQSSTGNTVPPASHDTRVPLPAEGASTHDPN